jgi:hypothetical protein
MERPGGAPPAPRIHDTYDTYDTPNTHNTYNTADTQAPPPAGAGARVSTLTFTNHEGEQRGEADETQPALALNGALGARILADPCLRGDDYADDAEGAGDDEAPG